MGVITPEVKPSEQQGPRGASPLWGRLEPGPHWAGFQLTCRYDFSRLYAPPYQPGIRPAKRFRPILQALWYPAQAGGEARPILYREYFAADGISSEFHEFLMRLFAFNLDMASRYGLHKPRTAQNPQERAAFEAWLDTPTAAVRNAAPLAGPFPLVLYHPGLGSSYEDNAVFCEYLATHGYVVLSSAYPAEHAASLGIDGDFERSARDVQFLLNSVGAQANVDLERVAVMGHSYGAHTASSLRAFANSPVDAVVSLDSTMEYFEPDAELWAGLRARITRPERQTVPMLLFSGMRQAWTCTEGSDNYVFHPELPFFDCYDALPYAKRYYAAVHHLDHPDFVSQGAWLGRIRRALAGAMAQGEQCWDTYETVCRCAHRFLDAVLKRDAAAEAFLAEAAHSAGDADSAIVMRIESAFPSPPMPHHLVEAMLSEGTTAIAALCRQFPKEIDAAALRRAAQGLVERQRGAEAITLLRLAADLHPRSVDVYCDLAEALQEAGQPDEAVQCCRAALERIETDATLDEDARERAKQRPTSLRQRLTGEK